MVQIISTLLKRLIAQEVERKVSSIHSTGIPSLSIVDIQQLQVIQFSMAVFEILMHTPIPANRRR